jgi:hypothetical protein
LNIPTAFDLPRVEISEGGKYQRNKTGWMVSFFLIIFRVYKFTDLSPRTGDTLLRVAGATAVVAAAVVVVFFFFFFFFGYILPRCVESPPRQECANVNGYNSNNTRRSMYVYTISVVI